MERKYSVVCNEQVATEIDDLAQEYGVSHQEVIRQLLNVGLEAVQD